MITANTFFRFNLDSVSYRLPSTHKFPPKSIFTYPTISFLWKKVKSDCKITLYFPIYFVTLISQLDVVVLYSSKLEGIHTIGRKAQISTVAQ